MLSACAAAAGLYNVPPLLDSPKREAKRHVGVHAERRGQGLE
jgi:hypothetical protein